MWTTNSGFSFFISRKSEKRAILSLTQFHLSARYFGAAYPGPIVYNISKYSLGDNAMPNTLDPAESQTTSRPSFDSHGDSSMFRRRYRPQSTYKGHLYPLVSDLMPLCTPVLPTFAASLV